MAGALKRFSNNFWLFNIVRSFFTPYMIEKKKGALLFDGSELYRINLNCKGDAYYGYVNIDEVRTKARVFVSPMYRLPFTDNKVKVAFLDFETIRHNPRLSDIFHELARVIVPNGILTIDNIRVDELIADSLSVAGFKWVFKESQRYLPVAHFVYSPKENFIKQNTFFIAKTGNTLVLKREGGGESILLENLGLDDENFEEIRLLSVLNCISPDSMEGFLLDIKKALKPGARLELELGNEAFLENGRFISFFDKGNLAQYLTETGFIFESMELKEGVIKAVVRKKGQAQLMKERKKRVCAIGQYMMIRYNQLGFDWDGIPRAMDELGYDYILLDGMRNISYKDLHEAILSYKPDYILVGLKETLPILFDISAELKKMGTKTIFWFTDPDEPWQMDLNGVLDFMFLSNTGQLEDYKKAFNIKNVYFMAQPCTPSLMRHCDVPEEYDIGFTGALSRVSLHDTRRKVLKDLSEGYSVAVTNNTRNNVSEFYSRSKIVFGASDFKYELYTSNRIFVAMSCARAYLTNRFPGIERLVENKKHVLWFDDYSEVIPIVRYYLKHDSERRRIGENAANLAHSKHTYAARLKNIFDIAEGRTEKFYGFLE